MSKIKKLYQEHKQILPLLILVALCINTLITAFQGTIDVGGQSYPYSLSRDNYIAFAIVALNCVIYIFSKKVYFFTLIATLILGFFSFINFTELVSKTTYSFGDFLISLQPYCLYILIFVVIINLKKSNKTISVEQSQESQDKTKVKREVEVDKYKRLYKNRSVQQLEELLKENRMTDTARIAAEEMLKEKQQAS